MVLGEAPGRVEDRLGRPFVGNAGVLLRKSLRHVGIDPDAGTFANVVCCWPSDARTPEPTHIAACRSNLRAQWDVCEAKWVLVCGKFAAQALLPHATIKYSCGKLVEAHGKQIFIVRHPASFISGRATKDEYYAWLQQLGDFRDRILLDELGEWEVRNCLYCGKQTYPSSYSLTCRGHRHTLQADQEWKQGSDRWWKTNTKNTRQSKATEERML